MTFILFLLAFGAFMLVVLNLLPVSTPLPQPFVDSFNTIVGSMKAWDFIFPITELLTLVVLVTAFHVVVLLFKLFRWIIHVVRGSHS